jgi:uncharacterized protein YndB with AHSA1/START domain
MPAQQVHVQRTIPGEAAAIFAVYADHARWKEWVGVPARIERAGSPDPNGAGCIRVLGPRPFAAREEILEFSPPDRLTYRVLSGGLPMRNHHATVDFTPVGGGVRIDWRCEFESVVPGLGGIFRRNVSRLFGRVLDGIAKAQIPAG